MVIKFLIPEPSSLEHLTCRNWFRWQYFWQTNCQNETIWGSWRSQYWCSDIFFFPQIVILGINSDLKFLFNLNRFFFPSISFCLQHYSYSSASPLWSRGKWSCMIFMSAERKPNIHSVKSCKQYKRSWIASMEFRMLLQSISKIWICWKYPA